MALDDTARAPGTESGLPATATGPAVDARAWISTRRERVTGRVVASDRDHVTIRLGPVASVRLPRWTSVGVEWVRDDGLARAKARVAGTRADARGAIVELRLIERAAIVERREQMRVPLAVEVEAWSLLDPTARASGRTIDLSARGVLAQLPALHPAAESVDLRLHLPSGPFATRARVVRREEGVVGLAFEHLSQQDEQRLVELVVACLGQQ